MPQRFAQRKPQPSRCQASRGAAGNETRDPQARTWRLMTSRRVAGVLETYCTHSWPSAVHSLCSVAMKIVRAEK